jgi:transcriptional regulator with XRE-family HTH domain
MIMSPHDPPAVAIDGDAVRHIREEKRLTQLYVAKVVGVTTDTVSRWENNRYPTIRRDNALKLAEALEVGLEEILRRAEQPVDDDQPKPVAKRRLLMPLMVLMVLLLAGGWYLFQAGTRSEPVLHAKRLQPRYAAPGSRILVRLQLFMESPLKGVIVKEQFPAGWTLVAAVPPASSIGNQGGTARWMLRNPAAQTTIAYLLEVAAAADADPAPRISGEVIANPDGHGSPIPVSAGEPMRIAALHWADADGNQVIDDSEILEISDLFDETAELRSEWQRIEELWDAGGYRWDKSAGRFVPVPGE